MNRIVWTLVMALAPFVPSISGAALGGEIGFIEQFALAKDRTVPLKQLIPGTEDYYYFHSLHYQNTEQYDKVDELLKSWIERYQHTPRVIEIQNRQALLLYPKNPQRALELIRQRLNLQFNHQREQLNQKPNLPTSLNPAVIAPNTLTQRAFASRPNTVEGFEAAAWERIAAGTLTPEQRRHLLSLLPRPDVANLVKLIVDDLNYKNSGGFGSLAIHRLLLKSQLDELLKAKPDLKDQTAFVQTYLLRLHPSDDVNWRQNPKELEAYLDRLLAYVRTLGPSENSLKAHVLYHRLTFDRTRGVFNRPLFLEYIQLPRHVGYMAAKFLQLEESRRWAVNLSSDFSSFTMLPPVGNDEPLVRSYLAQFFVEAADIRPFDTWINDVYLKHLFAETKIVNGLGDAEQWYSMLPPAQYQQLKERIDLEFAPANRTEFAVDTPVALDLFVKNVPTLIVKVFEINTQNYYRSNLREIGTDINLDGLVANDEKTYKYDEAPLRRVKRHFEFPKLDKRGVWVVDFIGNGVSSRALIRKGQLRYLVRTSPSGQVFTVLDEKNNVLPDASVWLGGNLHTPNKAGRIVTPFSNQPGRHPVVLQHGDFACLEHVAQESEQYELHAGMYVDREELLSRQTAQLIIRPSLRLNGTPISPKALEEVKLAITSKDLDGTSTTKVVPDFKLYEDRETVHDFQVPQRVQSLHFVLSARIKNLSQGGQKQDLVSSYAVTLNEIEKTEKIEDLHFVKLPAGYAVDLLGKTGEAQPSRPIQFALKLHDFKDPVYVPLQTDDAGRVTLGPLPGVATVTATGPQGTSHTWLLPRDEHTFSSTLNADAEQTIVLPYVGVRNRPERNEISLLELRGGHFVADRFEHVALKGGMLQITNLPPGDYSLAIKPHGPQVRISVTAGKTAQGYVLGDYRKLELVNPKPLQIESVNVADETIQVKLANATKFARVHVFATRFRPAYPAFDELSRIRPPEPYRLRTPTVESLYVAGRNIGDEYRYIIDRRFKTKFPGNMLQRPELLLNPWAIRSTQTGQQDAQAGDDFRRRESGGGGMGGRGTVQNPTGVGGRTDFANLDFLAQSSLVLTNLVANDEGLVSIKRADLGSHQDILIVAVDPDNTASRRVTLPEPETEYRDLRLAGPLDIKTHFTQQKRITVIPSGQKFVLPDITSTKFQSYDTLTSVYLLYSTLNPQPHWDEFRFILDWPKLKSEEKKELYSKHASHELSFFLFKKDPQFFKEAIQPYLANKKDKTFLDRWMVEADLSTFTQPWNYERLNTFERILLSQRLPNERPETRRFVQDHFDLIPPNIERFNHLFRTALKGNTLDTDDRLGLDKASADMLEKGQTGRPREGKPDEGAAADFRRQRGFLAGAMPSSKPADAPMGGPAAAPPAPRAERADAAKDENAPGESKAAAKKSSGKSAEQLKALRDSYNRKGDASERRLGERSKRDGKELAEEMLFDDAELAEREEVRQYYRKLDKTMEWAENNYYKLPIEQQNQQLITVNGFWNDYAGHDPAQPFLSINMAEPTHNFAEMLIALSLLDLPFEAPKHDTQYDGPKLTLTSAGPVVAYHEEILPAKGIADPAPILVSQNFFRHGDRFRHVNNEQLDKFITDEFLADVVYGCHIVVTNPTSSPRKLDVLLQIPEGSIPVLNGQVTKSVHLDLQPYHTQTLEYHFYFPASGEYPHYPVHVGSGDQVLAFAQPFTFKVVNEPTNIDKESWDYLSQHGTNEQVLEYLKKNNAFRTNLERIAFRMKDKEFFRTIVNLLTLRHAYNHTLWSYGVLHNETAAVREFLQHADAFLAQCGDVIDSPLVTTDPVARRTYEHLEYKPLVNARVNQLGKNREILNDRFLWQYQRLMKQLSYRRQLSDADQMAVTYYLLLQDRVEDGIEFFEQVNADALPTRLQYDYCTAYLGFSREQPEQAKAIALKYANHPVDRWRNAFAAVVAQADELTNKDAKLVDDEDRNQRQTQLAATEPNFDFTVESKRVKLEFQNLKTVQVSYYLMDVELLFSRNPFVQGHSGQFSFIRPNATQTVTLPAKGTVHEFALPEQFHRSNVLVEIVGGGVTKSHAYYANVMAVQTIENYGQVKVTHGGDARPLSKVYVKVYARMQDGQVKFYKDGYTDLRGRFDYTSLSTNELDFVKRFSLLVFSDEHGAVVREVNPPKQ